MIGYGVASAIRGVLIAKSGVRMRLARDCLVTVETDMTDIGQGSYIIAAQAAAEMMGVPLTHVVARLGDSFSPETPGSGGQQGAASVTAGVYAACLKLREAVAARLGFSSTEAVLADGQILVGDRSVPLTDVASNGDLAKRYAQQTFGAQFHAPYTRWLSGMGLLA